MDEVREKRVRRIKDDSHILFLPHSANAIENLEKYLSFNFLIYFLHVDLTICICTSSFLL